MTLVITGGSGKLGRELNHIYPDALTPTHEEMDLCDSTAIRRYISNCMPTVVIHTAALTLVRKCEENKELAWRTNVLGTKELIKACLLVNDECYFIYVSTACVFFGGRGMYTERDLPYPKNFYSLTKLLGEFVVQSYNHIPWLIIRTNFVYKERWPYPKAFIDRFGTYLFAEAVAAGIKEVVEKNMRGVVHIVGDRKMSMYELAKITTPDIEPMTLAEYQGPPLTVDMSLDTIRWKKYQIGARIP